MTEFETRISGVTLETNFFMPQTNRYTDRQTHIVTFMDVASQPKKLLLSICV